MKKKSITSYKFHLIAVFAVMVLLVLGMIVGAAFFARPKKSVAEKRELEKFPKMSLSDMMKGSFFKDVSLWYADTYPGREGLIAMNGKVKSLYGLSPKEKMVGTGAKADEIPVKEKKQAASDDLPDVVEPPSKTKVDEAVQEAVTGDMYIKDGTAYNVYYFTQSLIDRYASIMNAAAKSLGDETSLYSIMVPTNVVLLDKDMQKKIGDSDQAQSLQYLATKMSDKVNFVYLPKILAEHNDEYLFFRTDHHWTADGAYYAYKKFCDMKGLKAHKRSYFKETREFKPFLGTYYQKLRDESLAKTPDTVKAYIPNGTNDAEIITTDDETLHSYVIVNADAYSEKNKYLTFLHGDDSKQVTIVNDQIEDESACLVLCDSYGNCFVPFLVDHYHTVYVLDYRHTDENVIDFCKDKNIEDLLVVGSIKVLPTKMSLDKLQIDLLGK